MNDDGTALNSSKLSCSEVAIRADAIAGCGDNAGCGGIAGCMRWVSQELAMRVDN